MLLFVNEVLFLNVPHYLGNIHNFLRCLSRLIKVHPCKGINELLEGLHL